MSIYELPKFKTPEILKRLKRKKKKSSKNPFFKTAVLAAVISLVSGLAAGTASGIYFYLQIKNYLKAIPEMQAIGEKQQTGEKYEPQTTEEQAIINAVKEYSPAVVSIIITKDVPVIEQYYYSPFERFDIQIPQYRQKGVEKQVVGGGTGFIVSSDGLILTNRHVVSDEEAGYTVFTIDGKKYNVKVLARDSVQDLAIIKIEQEIDSEGKLVSFPVAKLGDSDKIQTGQKVIAIGYALGEFQNTVSVGVVSGLSRSIVASGGGQTETLKNLIQTDAAINKGNSGGPLLNLSGEVIGINVAIAESAENIGFAIPVNRAKRDISQVKATGEIVYPFLGIYWQLITPSLKEEKGLPVDYGVFIVRGDNNNPAVFPGSAAEKAGLKEGDIILEFDNKKITSEKPLDEIILNYNPGDEITLKILRNNKEENIKVVLGRRT